MICILFAVTHPALTFAGAAQGLQIWFFHLLPTLLPFIICANFFLSRPVLNACRTMLPKNSRRLLPFLPAMTVLLTGYTFGLPIGAKMTASFLQSEAIGKKEAQVLLNHCNIIGPAFLNGFLMTQCLKRPDLQAVTLALIYGPQLISLFLQLGVLYHKKKSSTLQTPPSFSLPGEFFSGKRNNTRKETPRLRNYFQILDAAIMNGFETITILGGYLILFGILCAFLQQITIISPTARNMILGICEITTGIHSITTGNLPFPITYLFCTTLCSFGGLCTLMQTMSVIKGTSLSAKKYFLHKLFFAAMTFLATFWYVSTVY